MCHQLTESQTATAVPPDQELPTHPNSESVRRRLRSLNDPDLTSGVYEVNPINHSRGYEGPVRE